MKGIPINGDVPLIDADAVIISGPPFSVGLLTFYTDRMTRLSELVRRFWPLIVTIAAVALFGFLIWPGWAYQWDWAGFGASRSPIKNPKAPFDYYPAKTLWDWLQLLIIPLAVVGVGYVLNRAQQQRDRTIADANRAQDQKATQNREMDLVLDNYLTQMAALLIQEGLSDPQPNERSGARQLGRVQTLTALRRLDGPRKRTIVTFLYEAQLIGYVSQSEDEGPEEHPAVLELSGADLSDATLDRIDLAHAYLNRVNLSRAHLRRSNLYRARLAETNLLHADLSGADLSDAKVYKSNLSEAILTGADLHGANLHQAVVKNEQLNAAKSLGGATLPDGTTLPHDFKGPLPL